ncbi:MAG: DUF1080 domain-containing protein [Bacteroidota bacterium]
MDYRLLLLTITMVLCLGCKEKQAKENEPWRTKKIAVENQVHNQLLEVEKAQGWELLFDGKTLEGWHLYNAPDSTRFSAWEVKDGVLFCNATDESKVHGDLVTDTEYKNYELVFEWQIAVRGNSGVFINVQESEDIPTAYQSGPEYQLLEPSHMDNSTPLKRPGCLYGFSAQTSEVDAQPSGQWNTSRILQKDGVIQFYLNGKLTAENNFNTPEWEQQITKTHFANYPQFGKATSGKIALQNWYFEVGFRNMKLRAL